MRVLVERGGGEGEPRLMVPARDRHTLQMSHNKLLVFVRVEFEAKLKLAGWMDACSRQMLPPPPPPLHESSLGDNQEDRRLCSRLFSVFTSKNGLLS